jgi:hypothetical protein
MIDTVLANKSSNFSDDAVMAQVQAWQRDGLVRDLRATYRHEQATNPITTDWVLSAAPAH